MKAKIGALVAAVAAAASTAGAAAWAKRRKGGAELDVEASEPVAGAAEAAGTTKAADVAEAADTADAADDLTTIKGIGAARAEGLRGIGVTTFAQVADWSGEDIDAIAPQIKVTADRVRREDWVGQARAAREG